MLYEIIYLAVNNQYENKVSIPYIKILCWVYGKNKQDKIINNNIRNDNIVEKMVENRLRWFEHVERKTINFVVRRVDRMKRKQTTRDR